MLSHIAFSVMFANSSLQKLLIMSNIEVVLQS